MTTSEPFAPPVSPWGDRQEGPEPQPVHSTALVPLDLSPDRFAPTVTPWETDDERRERLAAANCGGGPVTLSAADRRRLDTLEDRIGHLAAKIGSTGRAIAAYQRDLLINGLVVSFEAPARFMPTRRTVAN